MSDKFLKVAGKDPDGNVLGFLLDADGRAIILARADDAGAATLATAAKQDTAQSRLNVLATESRQIGLQSAADAVANGITSIKNNEGIRKIATALPAGTNNIGKVTPVSGNTELAAAESLVWDGIVTEKLSADIAVASSNILISVDNTCDKAVTVTFQHKIGSVYYDYYGADGEALSFVVGASAGKGVFGPIQGWPKFSGGRIVVTAAEAPTDAGVTIVSVREI